MLPLHETRMHSSGSTNASKLVALRRSSDSLTRRSFREMPTTLHRNRGCIVTFPIGYYRPAPATHLPLICRTRCDHDSNGGAFEQASIPSTSLWRPMIQMTSVGPNAGSFAVVVPRQKRQPRKLNFLSCSFCRKAKVKVKQAYCSFLDKTNC
jgi:hypothetical protein